MNITMRKLFVFLLLLGSLWMAQYSHAIGYQYILLEKMEYEGGGRDIWGVENYIINRFNYYGYDAYKIDAMPDSVLQTFKKYPQAFLYCTIVHSGPDPIVTMSMSFYNCNKEKVTTTSANTSGHFTMKGAMQSVIRSCIRDLGYSSSSIDSWPKNKYPWTNIDEDSARHYIDNNYIDQLEGIYKTLEGNDYKFLIKKTSNSTYDCILLEQKENIWFVGDIKAQLEKMTYKNLYVGKWFPVTKFNYWSVNAKFENNILTFSGTNFSFDCVKLYPGSGGSSYPTPSSPNGEGNWVASGSGFFVSDRIIATNNHVIEDANSVKIVVKDGNDVKSYAAKVLITDKTNDLALVSITDKEFKGTKSIPYNLYLDTKDVGTSIFTMGYPMSNILGGEIKITDGIISSKTGFQGDIVTYQITAPIQPGNSGGALFDKNGVLVGITNAGVRSAENVGYAIKTVYLKNLIEVAPVYIELPQGRNLKGKDLPELVKILSPYVVFVEVY